VPKNCRDGTWRKEFISPVLTVNLLKIRNSWQNYGARKGPEPQPGFAPNWSLKHLFTVIKKIFCCRTSLSIPFKDNVARLRVATGAQFWCGCAQGSWSISLSVGRWIRGHRGRCREGGVTHWSGGIGESRNPLLLIPRLISGLFQTSHPTLQKMNRGEGRISNPKPIATEILWLKLAQSLFGDSMIWPLLVGLQALLTPLCSFPMIQRFGRSAFLRSEQNSKGGRQRNFENALYLWLVFICHSYTIAGLL